MGMPQPKPKVYQAKQKHEGVEPVAAVDFTAAELKAAGIDVPNLDKTTELSEKPQSPPQSTQQ
jgi:kynurenine formamidase